MSHFLLNRRGFLRTSSAAVTSLWLSGHGLRADEPQARRSPLKVQSESPFNAEPHLDSLITNRLTPVDQFFVRCHGPVPKLNADAVNVSVEGLVHRPRAMTLAEIRAKFVEHTVEATLTCAGNRRSELSQIKKVGGVAWEAGAISHAEWSGAALSDILKSAELKPDAKHVWFEGADLITEKDGSVAPFGASIPLAKAMALDAQVPGGLIAYLMNGQTLTPEHGFPFRTIVPGYIGARSVKWLNKIVVSDRPSPNHYVADAYKLVQTDSAEERAKLDPIYEFVVNGAIGSPVSGATVKGSKVTVSGYALPTGRPGCTIQQVSVSSDGGKSWTDAKLNGTGRAFCWQLWSAELPVTAATQQLMVRVRDSLGNEQPEKGAWNFKGYLYNGWHNVPVKAGA